MTQSKGELLRQVDGLRDLARRSRRLAPTLTRESDQRRLLQYGVELDENAGRLEKEAVSARAMIMAPASMPASAMSGAMSGAASSSPGAPPGDTPIGAPNNGTASEPTIAKA